MTAYNVVRFRVKPGMEDAFIASQRKSLEQPMAGGLDAALIKTGERSYCFVGKWDKFEIDRRRPPDDDQLPRRNPPLPRGPRQRPRSHRPGVGVDGRRTRRLGSPSRSPLSEASGTCRGAAANCRPVDSFRAKDKSKARR